MRRPVIVPFQPGSAIDRDHGPGLHRVTVPICRRCRPSAYRCAARRSAWRARSRTAAPALNSGSSLGRPLDVAVGPVQAFGPPVQAQPGSRRGRRPRRAGVWARGFGLRQLDHPALVVDSPALARRSTVQPSGVAGGASYPGTPVPRKCQPDPAGLRPERKRPTLGVGQAVVLDACGRSPRRSCRGRPGPPPSAGA